MLVAIHAQYVVLRVRQSILDYVWTSKGLRVVYRDVKHSLNLSVQFSKIRILEVCTQSAVALFAHSQLLGNQALSVSVTLLQNYV